MLAQGKIKLDEANRARRSPIEVSRKVCEAQASTIAPYYSYVFQELEYLLGEQLAREGNFIHSAGSTDASAGRSSPAALTNAGSIYGFPQGAVVTLDSGTGAVLALTGGTDYKQVSSIELLKHIGNQAQPSKSLPLLRLSRASRANFIPVRH